MGVFWEACMRVFSRIALTLIAVFVLSAPTALASHLEADCPLRLVASSPPANVSAFYRSPHGAFRFGNQLFVLRGQTLTTFTVNDLGDLQIARQDFIGTLGAREANGGVTFSNGLLYVSSEAGLEIFDLRNVRAGGSPPSLLSRTPGLHYRRLSVTGTILAAVFPATDFPCQIGGPTVNCFNTVDLFTVANPAAPTRVSSISSAGSSIGGFNDVAFNLGNLVVTGNNGTAVFGVSNPAAPLGLSSNPTPGTFLVSSGAGFVGVGNDTSILTFAISSAGLLSPLFLHTVATLRLEHSNPIMFHPQATFDEVTSRLITMVDELDPQTLQPARTFAFNVFDYSVAMFEGKDPREYEQVSYMQSDEVKHNPLAVGPFVFVVGEVSGVQEYGACGQVTGRIDWDGLGALPCGGAEIHGWVTGANKIANVELFLDGGSLGTDTELVGPQRIDIPSTTPVTTWRIKVTLENTAAGEHVLRAVATDVLGNRRQFASTRVLFGKADQNCFRRRATR